MFDPKTLDYAVERWVANYKKMPFITVTITITTVALFVSFGMYLDYRDKVKQKELRNQYIDYDKQISQLDETEGNLKNLIGFIQEQKISLRDTQIQIDELKIEQNELAPVVEANRETIEAIFQAQEKRSRKSVWKERGIGFLMGLATSFIATVMWSICVYISRKKKEKEQQQLVV